jgi:glycosyltransferase involved in cell wall biosynthesis
VPRRIAHFRIAEYVRQARVRQALTEFFGRRLIARHATAILGVSEAALSDGWSPEWRGDARCKIVYNGLDLDEYDRPVDRSEVRASLGVPEDATLYMHVGTLRSDKAKNQERLVEIFREIAANDPAARLVFVGKGGNEIEAEVQRAVAAHGLGERVALLGVRSDVPRLLAAADMFIFPSRYEGLPGALLEASAAGLPVLGSDIPAIREIAGHLSTVAVLPLAAPDGEWARVAAERARRHRGDTARAAIRAEFRASPFRVELCAEELVREWMNTRASPCAV